IEKRERFVKEKAEVIRGLLRQGFLDGREGIGYEILGSLQAHNMDKAPLAVRSSAVQEDTQEAAFAGAAETYLYVDRDHLLEKTIESGVSCWVGRVILYRAARGIKQ